MATAHNNAAPSTIAVATEACTPSGSLASNTPENPTPSATHRAGDTFSPSTGTASIATMMGELKYSVINCASGKSRDAE